MVQHALSIGIISLNLVSYMLLKRRISPAVFTLGYLLSLLFSDFLGYLDLPSSASCIFVISVDPSWPFIFCYLEFVFDVSIWVRCKPRYIYFHWQSCLFLKDQQEMQLMMAMWMQGVKWRLQLQKLKASNRADKSLCGRISFPTTNVPGDHSPSSLQLNLFSVDIAQKQTQREMCSKVYIYAPNL